MLKKIGLIIVASLFALNTVPRAFAEDQIVIKIASHLPPMTDIIEIVEDVIDDKYDIELVEVSDNIQYNQALLNDEVYANFAQHAPFMAIFNEKNKGDLVAVQAIYNARVGFYSPTFNAIDQVSEGAKVAIPSDPTNMARALMILASYDLIELKEGVDSSATTEDIVKNDKNLVFEEIDLLNLTAAYEDGLDLVFNYPTYISKINLSPEDALMLEKDPENTFAIQVVVREKNKDSDATKALIDAFTSPEVYSFIEELAKQGHLFPAFQGDSQ